MENNIFYKNKKDKFNPDVIAHLSKKSSERKKTDFEPSKNIYNPITNIVPDRIKSVKDLYLQKDEPFENVKKTLTNKKDERSKQDFELKPQKLKNLPDHLILDKHIENFEELKNNSEIHIKQTIQEHKIQKNKYENIMSNLKGLGILK
jgi:hypothetical protein